LFPSPMKRENCSFQWSSATGQAAAVTVRRGLFIGVLMLILSASFPARADGIQLCWPVQNDGRIVDDGTSTPFQVCAHYSDFQPVPPDSPDLPPESSVVIEAKFFGASIGRQIVTTRTGGNEGDAVCRAPILNETVGKPGFDALTRAQHEPVECRASSSQI